MVILLVLSRKQSVKKNAFYANNIGYNSQRCPHSNNHITTHAEIDALMKIENLIRCGKIKSKNVDLYVIRIDKHGQLKNSAPCKHCTIELKRSKLLNIKNIYFSNNNDEIECIKFTEWINSQKYKISTGYLRYNNKNKH